MKSVTEAVLSRKSIRAFQSRPVPKELVVEILDVAKRSPSGGNLQPWLVYGLAGAELDRFLEQVRKVFAENPFGEGSEFDVYPKGLVDPYRARRFKCGEDLYATIGIEREDKAGRLTQFARNFELFGAPVALFFCIDRSLGRPQWAHLGMFIQTIMLLADERGLATCPQEAWSAAHKTVSSFLGLPDNVMLYCGMALGYADNDHPINTLVTDRVPVEEFATLRGFD